MILQAINWNPEPVLFDLGAVAIRWYSLSWVAAFLLGIYIEKKIYKKDGMDEEIVDSLFMYVAIATILGARLGEVFFYSWGDFKDKPWQILFPVEFSPFKIIGFAGLASHGAAIGVILAIFLFKKYRLPQKSYLWIIDRVVIAVPVGGAFIRLGNLMNSEIVGKYTNTDYGFIFQKLGDSAPRYPTQIYEAIGYVFVFVVLIWMYWKTNMKQREGVIFGWFMILLWMVRFVIEFWKEKQGGESIANYLNMGQILSIPMILIGVYFVFRKTETKS